MKMERWGLGFRGVYEVESVCLFVSIPHARSSKSVYFYLFLLLLLVLLSLVHSCTTSVGGKDAVQNVPGSAGGKSSGSLAECPL